MRWFFLLTIAVIPLALAACPTSDDDDSADEVGPEPVISDLTTVFDEQTGRCWARIGFDYEDPDGDLTMARVDMMFDGTMNIYSNPEFTDDELDSGRFTVQIAVGEIPNLPFLNPEADYNLVTWMSDDALNESNRIEVDITTPNADTCE